MDDQILKKVLQLDSLIGFLTWQERTDIHRKNDISSSKIKAAYEWVISEKWNAPPMKYGQDRLLYYYDPDKDTWMCDETYLKNYPQYKEIENFKNI